ncbi:hypothetical protein ACIOG8_17785 [Streptomyces erythrochromogenes]|uniref:hypothetical protein n=1 Tax=Streptomyces erythrochromogenes TaxID=285574 RepID=UPI00382EB578
MTSASRPPSCHFAHQMSTAFSDTPNKAATSSRSRPATNAATARNRRASCADGDRRRASPTRSLTPHPTGKITDFAGEADAADASELRDYTPIKQIALIACLTHKAGLRVRDDLATMFCKRVATKIKKAKEEFEEIRLAEREIVEALIGNYRTVLKNIDADGPAQEAVQKAAAMTAEVRHALEGLDDEAPVDEVAQRLDGKVSPAVLAMAKALVVQAGGLSAVTKAVEALGGFAGQYEQIEKVSAHHGNFWECCCTGRSAGTVR